MNDTNTDNQTSNPTPIKNSNKNIAVFFIIIITLSLLIGGYYLYKNKNATTPISNESELMDEFAIEGTGPVAKVNGVEISRDAYKQTLEQTITLYQSQGLTIADSETVQTIKDQVIDGLISRQLILEAAMNSEITIEDSSIDTEYQNTINNLGGEEAFQVALTEAGIDADTLRSDIRDGLLINKYLASEVNTNNMTVSDEEVRSFYEQAKTDAGEGVEIPALEEVFEIIKSQLLSQMEQNAINAKIESLKTNANIEILI